MKKILMLFAAATLLCACGNNNNPDDPQTPDTPDTPSAGIVYSPEGESFLAENMSPDMKYAAGLIQTNAAPAIWDIKNNKVVEFDLPAGADDAAFHAVNNAGIAVGDADYAIKGNVADGKLVTLYFNRTSEAGAAAYAITDDGQTIAGFHYDDSWATVACVWKGEGTQAADRIDLPAPSEEEFGGPVAGTGARWISADGKVILGYAEDDFGAWVMIHWTLEGDQYAVHCDYEKQYYAIDWDSENPYVRFEPMALSANGQWATLVLQDLEYNNLGARLNLTTGELQTCPAEVDEDLEFYGIANDGTAVGTSLTMSNSSFAYFWAPGIASPKLSYDAFPALFTDIQGELGFMGITPDATAILGDRYVDGEVCAFVAYIK